MPSWSRPGAGWRSLPQRLLEYFGSVEGAPTRRVRDLLAAAEAVGDDERVGVSRANGRKQRALADLHRDVVVVGLVTE